jgi:hypothetical protein
MTDTARESLPSALPIFPLEGAVLLPLGQLPLHVFEPRYRKMVEYALGHGRYIGMIQPRQAYPHPVPDDARLFEIGCAGKIIAFSEVDDGRYLVTLKGLCRFRLAEELSPIQGFRQVQPDFRTYLGDLNEPEDPEIDRERLLAAARGYFRVNAIECDWTAAGSAPATALIATLAMACPFQPQEKQALLECADVQSRLDLLVSLFDMAAIGGDRPGTGTRH